MKTTRIQTTALTDAIRELEKEIRTLDSELATVAAAIPKATKKKAELEGRANNLRGIIGPLRDRKRGLESARETVLEYERLSFSLRACLAETEEG